MSASWDRGRGLRDGPDEPETREILRDVAAAIEARRGDWPPE
jgi:hypothetical protein